MGKKKDTGRKLPKENPSKKASERAPTKSTMPAVSHIPYLNIDTDALLQRIVDLRLLREKLISELPSTIKHDECTDSLDQLEQKILDSYVSRQGESSGRARVTIAVVGDFSAGKSTFVNALLGQNLCPVDVRPTTSSITYFTYGSSQRVELEQDDKTRTEISTEEYKQLVRLSDDNPSQTYTFHVCIPSVQLYDLCLVDTPGFNNPYNQHDTDVTERAAKAADALLVIVDVRKGNPNNQLLTQLDRLRADAVSSDQQTPAFLVINQADRQPSLTALRKLQENIQSKHGELFREILLVSSLNLSEVEGNSIFLNLLGNYERIKDAIRHRREFDVRLIGRRIANDVDPAYEVSVDGHREQLCVQPDDHLATRADLEKILSSLMSERKQLISRKQARESVELRKCWKSTLNQVSRDLAATRRKKAQANNDDSNDSFSALIGDLKGGIFEMLIALLKECSVKALKAEKSSVSVFRNLWWREEKIWNVIAAPNLAYWHAQRHGNWVALEEEFKRFGAMIKQDYSIEIELDPRTLRKQALEYIQQKCNEARVELEMAEDDRETTLESFSHYQELDAAYGRIEDNVREMGVEVGGELSEQIYEPYLSQIENQVLSEISHQQKACLHGDSKIAAIIEFARKLQGESL